MILVTGCDGYLGWPLWLRLARLHPDELVAGVDTLWRRRWVAEVGGQSVTPVAAPDERLRRASLFGWHNLRFVETDLRDTGAVERLVALLRPRVILHLAAQPSGPYSDRDAASAVFTQANNAAATANLLWAARKAGLDDARLVVTTTMGIYGAPDFPVPEGTLSATVEGVDADLPYPGMGGSWYHMGRAFDAANLWLAHRQWGARVTELRTGIVYGAETAETALHPDLAGRLDCDPYFGTVVHRFCAQAVCGAELTVYGGGERGKPFITLEDAVRSLAAAADEAGDGLRVYNQATEVISVRDLADAVSRAAAARGLAAPIRHVPNPRSEREEHEYRFRNDRFLALVGGTVQRLDDALPGLLDVIARHRDRVAL